METQLTMGGRIINWGLIGASSLLLFFASGDLARAAGDESDRPASCFGLDALYESGRYSKAQDGYEGILTKEESDCAIAGLGRIDLAERQCAGAEALAGAGQDSKALEAYQGVLAAEPRSNCAEEGAARLSDGFWDSPSDSAQTMLSWLGFGALLLGGVVLLVAVVLLGMTRIRGLRRLWPANKVRAIRVGIDAFNDNAAEKSRGASLAALVRSKIESFGSESAGLRMIDSQAAIEETVWNKFGAINDQAKAVSAVLAMLGTLYPRRQYQASGALQPEGSLGPGLSLSLRKERSLANATTIWAGQLKLDAGEGDGGAGERVQRLAVAGAAWISHATTTAAGETPGGSTDPRSWAYFKTAREWEFDGEADKASALYKEAIAIDRENWGALANLGGLRGHKGECREGIELLEQSLRVLQSTSANVKTPPHRQNLDWYRVKYKLVAQCVNEAYVNKSDFHRAAKETDELLAAVWSVTGPSWGVGWARRRRNRKFLSELVEPAALSMKAIAQLGLNRFKPGNDARLDIAEVRARLRSGEAVTPKTIIGALESQEGPWGLVSNLACFYVLCGENERARELLEPHLQEDSESERRRTLEQLAEDPMLGALYKPVAERRCLRGKPKPEPRAPRAWV